VIEACLGHHFNNGKRRPADVVADGLQVRQLANSLGLDEHIGGLQLNLDLGECLRYEAVWGPALVVTADTLDHILQVLLEKSE